MGAIFVTNIGHVRYALAHQDEWSVARRVNGCGWNRRPARGRALSNSHPEGVAKPSINPLSGCSKSRHLERF